MASEEQRLVVVNLEEEMKQAYINYAMSVIVGRALPDVRDGLKPVHRRVLYAMNELSLTRDKPHKKSARVVGDVIGKYHPHGDAAAYDSIVRMAQDFSMRYPLINGQGNFGSVDGDPPAAMRYTEVRMAQIAQEILADIDKETVDFVPTYDESLMEPTVLPTRIPNLLINGSSGIAVGMATNIPPHNLGEVVDGLMYLLENPEATSMELMEFIKGPDFPTGGIIYGQEGLVEAYTTGRGIIQLRAKASIEKSDKGGKENIIVSELPYQINKAKLVEKIAELVKEKKIEGIGEVRDESDREGMRIVIELKRDEIADVILNQLYKHTNMQSAYGIIFLALNNNQPQVMNVKELLSHYLDFRREVVTRRARYDLRKAEEKAHILQGLKIALDNLEAVIALIKTSHTPQMAKEALMSNLPLTDIQVQAILDMRLQRLTGLERDRITRDLEETLKLITDLQELLKSEDKINKVIKKELIEIKEKYNDERLTEIADEIIETTHEDLIIEEDMAVTITKSGYIKRTPVRLYRSQKRGGKGIRAMEIKDEDLVEEIFVASTHDYILFFTNMGQVHRLKVHELPLAGRSAKGKALPNLLSLKEEEMVTAMFSTRDFIGDNDLIMATKRGILKKTPLNAYNYTRTGGIIAVKLDEGDELISVGLCSPAKLVFLATRLGKAVRFKEDAVREVGRTARGVKGIKLGPADYIIGMEITDGKTTILTVTEKGFGKRTRLGEYRIQARGGGGIANIKITAKNGPVVGIRQVNDQDELLVITSEGKSIRLQANGIPIVGRSTQGVKLINLDPGDKVVGLTKVEESN
ncbi:MAG: DNA gyrase subunit A [Nitrospinae bacterium RIFCSPLOWO2_12_FULL_45_22]|nr:MAG: DNA gyrase subunit A [Nitrospinae bacterium RIFCSPLOWO2_12_FULL_45_22]